MDLSFLMGTLGAILRVQEQDVGEVLLVLGVGIPVAAIAGVACITSGYEGFGRLRLSGAAIGVLPFLTLGCQVVAGV